MRWRRERDPYGYLQAANARAIATHFMSEGTPADDLYLYAALISNLVPSDQACEIVERMGGTVDPDWPRP